MKYSPEKSPVGSVYMRAYNFFVGGPKYTKFLTPNAGGVVVDHLLFTFSLCRSISELFVLKVESCQKSRRILNIFGLPSFVGSKISFQKLYPHYHACLAPHCMVKFRKGIPTNPEVIGTHTQNFKPNL